MRILFVLGNGFDLQLGLPTSYRDFYKYYSCCNSENESVRRLKKEIGLNPENWGDLELALAQYTSKEVNLDEFCAAYDDIQSKLQKYILTVDDMMKAGELNLNADVDSVFTGLRFPENYFCPEIAESLNEFYSSGGNKLINVDVFTFNYTHTLEYLLGNVLDDFESDDPRRYISRKFCHIHREITVDNSVWLGVDNDSQISNSSYLDRMEARFRLIKPEMIEAVGSTTMRKADNLISNADVICLFGASFGDSDLSWLKRIGDKVAEGTPTMSFIVDKLGFGTDNSKLVLQSRHKGEFAEKLNELGVVIDERKISFYTEINSKIFTNQPKNLHDENLKLVLERLGVGC